MPRLWRRRRSAATELYLDLLKRCLTRVGFEDESVDPETRARVPVDQERRLEGRDWPVHAETMIGMRRLDQLQAAVEAVLAERVPGDLVETGVWRGGASILMRGVLAAHGDISRTVWVCDSFEGLPPPGGHPADEGFDLSGVPELAVSLEKVRANFDRYGLLDEQVRFLPGWFRDTLADAPIDRVAVLRLDGDMYESTIVALEALYPKVSRGGFVIVDDYALPMCAQAVDDYRRDHGVTDPLVRVDWTGVHWRRSR